MELEKRFELDGKKACFDLGTLSPTYTENPSASLDRANAIAIAGDDKSVNLCLTEPTNEQLQLLVSTEQHYVAGLRTVMLRILLFTQAANTLTAASGFGITRVLDFLGFANYLRYAQGRTFSEIKAYLKTILDNWEATNSNSNWFPSSLRENLDDLATVVQLTETDKVLLGFTVLLHAEPLLEQCAELMGSELSGASVHIPLAHILDIKTCDVESALAQESNLHNSGLLTVDYRSRYNMKHLLDLLTPSFHTRMTFRQKDIRNLVAGFVKLASAGNLGAGDYGYVSDFYALVRDYLKAVFSGGKKGANILIHGVPGTGKSQFARAIAQELGINLMEISPTNLAGDAITPIRRLRSYGIAQAFYRSKGYVLLFDEIEEVLTAQGFNQSMDEATVAQKSFLNGLLENNPTPAIWIANDISEFDPAYIRRFDICMEMPVPPLSVRLGMLKDAFATKATVSETLLKVIAKHDIVTPALIQQAATVINMVSYEQSEASREKLLVSLINEKLRAQGEPVLNYTSNKLVHKMAFDPALVNCQANLVQMVQAMRESRSARLCLYGPPGTGKTAFGKWVAHELDAPHMVVTASNLLSRFVGGTEKNIARAFAAAKRDGAVLQLDEVDTFLADRRHSKSEYETSKVNEMLVQMENFDGVFIASTNLVEHLDEASLRRFDIAVKFDFITADAAKVFYRHICIALGLKGGCATALARITSMRSLTPGDFDQLLRRMHLTSVEDENAIVDVLEDAMTHKKSAPNRPIGFLRAA